VVSFSNCAQCLPRCTWVAYAHGVCTRLEGIGKATSEIGALRSGNADCEEFHGMFCGETGGTSPTPQKYPDEEHLAKGFGPRFGGGRPVGSSLFRWKSRTFARLSGSVERGAGRDPAAFFRDIVDLKVRMDPGHPGPVSPHKGTS
ncbi:unnamed protein product, partial [Allacma fusca]